LTAASSAQCRGEAMRELDLEAFPMIGVVKPPLHHNQVAYLLVKGREDDPIYLDSLFAVLRLIQMIRDETHRYAVTYHRKRRELRDFTSELSAIPGVGENEDTLACVTSDRYKDFCRDVSKNSRRLLAARPRPRSSDHFAKQRALAEGLTIRRKIETAFVQ
jgi:hypothetical protein